MLFVARCLLLADCGLLCVVCPLFVVCCLLLAGGRLAVVVSCWLLVVFFAVRWLFGL